MVLIFCSYTDCRDSLIRNSVLLKAGLIIGTLDIAYYIIYGTQYLVIFLFNAGLLAIISLMLYVLKIWAGGDSKLLLLISIAIPGRLYALNGSDNMSGILIIVFSFLSGVCQEFCVNFLEIFVIFFHQRAKPFINKQLVSNHRPIS